MKTALIGLVIASVALSLGGCASTASHSPVAGASPVVQEHDAQLVADVREQMAQEGSPAAIRVSASQGKVELQGTVAGPEEARKAVRSALAVDGVRGVVNDLKVGEPLVTAAVSTTD